MSDDNYYSERFLESFGPYIEQGWIFCSVPPNLQILAQVDRDCTIPSCPLAGTPHRHVPTLADREETYDIVTDWLKLKFEREKEQKAVRELNHIYALVDPRVSVSSDADAASIAECQRICALNPPERKRPTGVQHTLNLLRGLQAEELITPTDLRAEAQRLIVAGRMPSLDQLLETVATARKKFRPQIIAARTKPKRRCTRG
jgi:hypothetical protein